MKRTRPRQGTRTASEDVTNLSVSMTRRALLQAHLARALSRELGQILIEIECCTAALPALADGGAP